MKELVEYMARSLVDKPEEVSVLELDGEQGTVVELRVAKDDLGKVIGKRGRTARAMRAIVVAAAIRANKRVLLEIAE